MSAATYLETDNPEELTGQCPTNEFELEPIPTTAPEEVAAAVVAAREAQEGWARLDLDQRVARLEEAAKLMLERRGQIVDIVRLEIGKLEVDALFTEALGPLDTVRAWAKLVRREVGPRKVRLNPIAFPGKKASVKKVPRGVIGVIAPWNFPVAGLYRSVIPALLTGNAVVVKPSEHSPRSSGWFLDRLAEVLPAGLVQTVQGRGEVGEALIEAQPDGLVFTGSTSTGRAVAKRAAELGIPLSAEMGGNDAAIVLEDADLAYTTAGITQWALQNAGQSCGAIEILYVDHRIADALVSRLVRAWSRLRVGMGPVAEVDISPLAHEGQLEKVEAHVADAKAKGAEILCGGERLGEGLWYPPTLIDRCTEDMDVVREETFGPVLAIRRVEGPTEAIRHINRGRYGLGASLWTTDLERARRLADRIDVGVVSVNNHAMTGAIPELPWSGTRDTGLGIANGPESLGLFTRPKTLLVDEGKNVEPFWLPYDAHTWELGDLLSEAQLMRLERAWKLPIVLKRRIGAVKRFFV